MGSRGVELSCTGATGAAQRLEVSSGPGGSGLTSLPGPVRGPRSGEKRRERRLHTPFISPPREWHVCGPRPKKGRVLVPTPVCPLWAPKGSLPWAAHHEGPPNSPCQPGEPPTPVACRAKALGSRKPRASGEGGAGPGHADPVTSRVVRSCRCHLPGRVSWDLNRAVGPQVCH